MDFDWIDVGEAISSPSLSLSYSQIKIGNYISITIKNKGQENKRIMVPSWPLPFHKQVCGGNTRWKH
jgi:hypothetical protein